MAEANKTEQPTQRKLQKARQEGKVPQSQEMLSAITLITLMGITVLCGPWFVSWSKDQIRRGLSCDVSLVESAQAFNGLVRSIIVDVIFVMSPFLIALMAAGIAGSLLISGRNFAPQSLQWKLGNLNPVKGAMDLFSPQSVVKLCLSILKISFIGIIVWVYLHNKLNLLATMQWLESDELLAAIGKLIFGVVLRICIGLLVIGLIDLFYNKWKYIEQLKMTKQEIKYEHRDTDGPPELKTKIRQKQFEAAVRRMLQEVPKANVVLVNPDHVAVALRYDPQVMATPVVVAKGADHMCEKIKEIARAYGVPILRRPPLARELYATVKLGRPIPEKLYTVVAEILALIYRLRRGR